MMAVRGIKNVQVAFDKKVKRISQERVARAVYAVTSQGAAAAALRTPVDTSNLINSQVIEQPAAKGSRVEGRVIYTANYAGYVHKATGKLRGKPRKSKNGDYWDPNGEPAYLAKGFESIKEDIPAIVKAIIRED